MTDTDKRCTHGPCPAQAISLSAAFHEAARVAGHPPVDALAGMPDWDPPLPDYDIDPATPAPPMACCAELDSLRARLATTERERDKAHAALLEVSELANGPKLGGTSDTERAVAMVVEHTQRMHRQIDAMRGQLDAAKRGECLRCADATDALDCWHRAVQRILRLRDAPLGAAEVAAHAETRTLLAQALTDGLAECERLREEVVFEQGCASEESEDCTVAMIVVESQRDAALERVATLRAALEGIGQAMFVRDDAAWRAVQDVLAADAALAGTRDNDE